jgi:ribosome-associated protein
MLVVNDRVAIPLEEFQFEFTRSGGPGGQNVNKVSSRAVLRWRPAASPSLPEPVRQRLLVSLASRLTREGELLVSSQRTRDQGRNVEDCLDKLRLLVLAAAEPPRPRRPSRPTRASRIRRAEEKSRRSATKQLRRRPEPE